MTHSVSHTNDFQFTFDVLCLPAFTKRTGKKKAEREKKALIRTHAHGVRKRLAKRAGKNLKKQRELNLTGLS